MEQNTKDLERNIRIVKQLEADIRELETYDGIRAYLQVQKRFSISPLWKYASIAATIAVLIVSSLFLLTPEKGEQVAYIEISAVPGSKAKVTLPDSSVVWLNSNATLRYPREFTETSRTVSLSGEALFEVKKNTKKPFTVHTDGMSIQVLGTVFNVLAEARSNVIETTLIEGSVALFKEKSDTGKAKWILAPNEQALFYKKNGTIRIKQVDAISYTAWVSGKFDFQRRTLQEIASTLERAFNVKFHIDSEKLKNKRLTGRFTNHETLDEILSILQIPAHYTYKKEKGEIYITEN